MYFDLKFEFQVKRLPNIKVETGINLWNTWACGIWHPVVSSCGWRYFLKCNSCWLVFCYSRSQPQCSHVFKLYFWQQNPRKKRCLAYMKAFQLWRKMPTWMQKTVQRGLGGGGHDVERVQVMIREKLIFITSPSRNNNSRELLIVIYAADNPFYSHCTDVSSIKSKNRLLLTFPFSISCWQ